MMGPADRTGLINRGVVIDVRHRRERIALECLKVLLDTDESSPYEMDPIAAAVGKAVHAADLLIARLESEGGAA